MGRIERWSITFTLRIISNNNGHIIVVNIMMKFRARI